METTTDYLEQVRQGFSTLQLDEELKKEALTNLELWLTQKKYEPYKEQLFYLIEQKNWDELLDSFYQVIPFGTGGRRGLVGIGTNRINQITIESSAQGHAQFLLKKFGDDAKKRGVVLTFDVREYTRKGLYNDAIDNPVQGLSCKDLAQTAAEVYVANGIKVYLFDSPRSTPQLSFAIRHLEAISGDMFSASHNQPTDNGKKVYDEFGGQLIPPHDQELVDEVTKNVTEIKKLSLQEAGELVETLGTEIDDAYYKAVLAESLSTKRDISVLFSPLHGTSLTSAYPILKKAGFDVTLDEKTSNMSGLFENVTFTNPNPEVHASFDTLLAASNKHDLLINTDPDADRVGIMVRHKDEYVYLNGNEIGIVLTAFGIEQKRAQGILDEHSTVVKTLVTSSLIEKIAQENKILCQGDLLVGFKYVGQVMNTLSEQGHMKGFILGTEESHGFLAGDYARDKDASLPALWLCELAAELKSKNQTIVDYLHNIYSQYGYCHNYLTEVRLTGAAGVQKIKNIMKTLRTYEKSTFGNFTIEKRKDYLDEKPYVSQTDASAKNVLVFYLGGNENVEQIKVTIRPSGTEPKVKLYIELMGKPFDKEHFATEKETLVKVQEQVERALLNEMYASINVTFPERGYLLFWQLPLDVKLHYFDIEEQLAACKNIGDVSKKQEEITQLLSFLGKDPVKKMDTAFKARYGESLYTYVGID